LIHGITNCGLTAVLTGAASMAKSQKLLPPIHPGEILRVDFMEPLGLSMNRMALDLRVPVTRIAEIVHRRRGITPDTALRLGRYFNTSPGFWLNLQSAYDLEVAQDKLSRVIEREVRPASLAAANARF
jgi:antitoxin HigA-1